MGGGSYGYSERMAMNARQYNNNVKREEIFKQSKISEEMNIKGKIRECKDSGEHPDSFPIIIALDVTGSMGRIPDNLIRTGLPDIMKKLLESGVKDPQVCFVAIGDQYTDDAPIQVGQFESSDDLMDKWLKTVWLEGRGGGNGAESYELSWYFAAFHTDCDWIHKGRKGIIVSIGDDAVHRSISQAEAMKIFGSNQEKSLSVSELLTMVQGKWDVYHISLKDYTCGEEVISQWDELLGSHHILTESNLGDDIPKLISGAILDSYRKQAKKEDMPSETSAMNKENTGDNEAHLL